MLLLFMWVVTNLKVLAGHDKSQVLLGKVVALFFMGCYLIARNKPHNAKPHNTPAEQQLIQRAGGQ